MQDETVLFIVTVYVLPIRVVCIRLDHAQKAMPSSGALTRAPWTIPDFTFRGMEVKPSTPSAHESVK